MQAIQTVDETCEPCMAGNHHDHYPSDVHDYMGVHIGDQMRCRCTHRRRMPQHVWQAIIVTWVLLMICGAAFQIGLWLVLYG